MEKLGIPVIWKLETEESGVVKEWANSPNRLVIKYPDESETIIVDHIFKNFSIEPKLV